MDYASTWADKEIFHVSISPTCHSNEEGFQMCGATGGARLCIVVCSQRRLYFQMLKLFFSRPNGSAGRLPITQSHVLQRFYAVNDSLHRRLTHAVVRTGLSCMCMRPDREELSACTRDRAHW